MDYFEFKKSFYDMVQAWDGFFYKMFDLTSELTLNGINYKLELEMLPEVNFSTNIEPEVYLTLVRKSKIHCDGEECKFVNYDLKYRVVINEDKTFNLFTEDLTSYVKEASVQDVVSFLKEISNEEN